MATDARKHTVPAGTDDPDVVGDMAALSASIRDIIQVDNTTARTAVIDALTAAGIGPTATNPVYVHRSDAAPGRELEVTVDGTTWTAVATAGRDAGSVSIAPSGSNVATSVNVTFNRPFASPPVVVCGLATGLTGTVTAFTWPDLVTTTGFRCWLNRSSTTTTQINWVAVG